ncbi:SRPBCC domain-containing protein, partial [candidate division KSB1 bacterium]|nr:SRPBCC domain-containing protein [candidate division KSB1 bacterium]
EANEHYRVSCYCWAMYLRLLKRYVEHGETVPYEDRLDV